MATTVERVARCVAQVLAAEPSRIVPHARLVDELGADSLDLVELMFVLEQEFEVRFEKTDLSISGQLGLPEDEVHQDEVLTPRALERLREQHPEAAERLQPGLRRQDLAMLLTVEGVARAVDRKLASLAEAPRC